MLQWFPTLCLASGRPAHHLIFKKDRCVYICQSLTQSHPPPATAMGAASIGEKGCKILNGGQVSCRTGENLGFNVKNKQEQILASGNVSVCLSHSIKRPEKRPVHNFHFLSQPQMKCLVKLLVGNQWPM